MPGMKQNGIEDKNMTERLLILNRPIQELKLSHAFKVMARVNGFRTLQDIFDTSLYDLPFRPLSGYRILKELIDIAAEYDLPFYGELDFDQDG